MILINASRILLINYKVDKCILWYICKSSSDWNMIWLVAMVLKYCKMYLYGNIHYVMVSNKFAYNAVREYNQFCVMSGHKQQTLTQVWYQVQQWPVIVSAQVLHCTVTLCHHSLRYAPNMDTLNKSYKIADFYFKWQSAFKCVGHRNVSKYQNYFNQF